MNQEFIDQLKKEMEIDCPKEQARIVDFIRKSIKELHTGGAVIGLSGGLDSSLCAYLLEKALGKRKVLAVLLPERDSSPVNHEHARLIAKTLGLEIIDRDITKTLQAMGAYEIGPKKLESKEEENSFLKQVIIGNKLFFGGYVYNEILSSLYGAKTSTKWKIIEMLRNNRFHKDLAFQTTKVRLRMVYLYFYANLRNLSVIGTTDKSEYSTCLYINNGDGVSDIQILRHLYKTQLEDLARHMRLPEEIITKPHSADLYGNMPHTVAMGMGYEKLDMLLLAMDKGYPDEKLAEIVPEKGVKSIKRLRKLAGRVRKLPLSLDNNED
jgi:NAD+ synthase